MSDRTGERFSGRSFISVLTALAFLAVLCSGVVMFIKPPGRVANWTGWELLGLSKDQWGGLHICFSLLLVVVSLLHLYLNWRPFVSYFTSSRLGRFAFRKEWALAVLVSAVVGAGVLTEVTPFSSLLAWHDEIKHGREAGETLAPVQYHNVARGRSPRWDVGGSGGGQEGRGRGMGRMTLEQYCSGAGVDLKGTVDKLHAAGMKAEATMTLRDIAASGGVHPREIRTLL